MGIELRPKTVDQQDIIINLGGWALRNLDSCFKRYENRSILTLVDFDNLYLSIHDYEERYRNSVGLQISPLTTAAMHGNRLKVYCGNLGNSDTQSKRTRDYKKFGWLFDKFENLPLFTKDYARYQPTGRERFMFKFKSSEALAKRSYQLNQFYSEVALSTHGFSSTTLFFEDLQIADYLLARSRNLYSYFENLWMEVEMEKRKAKNKEEVVKSVNNDKEVLRMQLSEKYLKAKDGWSRFASKTKVSLYRNIANAAAEDYSERIKMYYFGDQC